MQNRRLIETLETRVTEVEWYGQQHLLRVEPHLYPKGLFHVQVDPVQRYHLPAYVAELRHDLLRLKNMALPLLRSKAAAQLLQKINVLINALRSQSLRRRKKTNVNALLGEVDMASGSVYDYFLKKNQPESQSKLNVTLDKQQKDMAKLMLSRDEKERALRREKDYEQRQALQATVLALSKQMGCIEQQITRIKEELARR